MTKAEGKDIKNRVEIARRLAREEYHPDYMRAMRLYRGEHYDDDRVRRDQDRIAVNYLYPIVETKVAALAFRYPDFTLKAQTREASEREGTARALLAYTFRKGEFLDEARRAFRDYQIGGLGVTITGWLTEIGESGQMGSRYEGARIPDPTEPTDPTLNTSDLPAASGPRREDRPFVKRICPKDFFVSPECGSRLQDALYCGYTERVPLAEVKKRTHYKGRTKLKGTSENLKDLFDEGLTHTREEDLPEDLKRVQLHHYYDLPRRLYVVISDEIEEPLYEAKYPFPYNRYPFRVVRADDDEDRFWPLPTLCRYEHPQREINQARTILARHQRQSVRAMQYNGKLSQFQRNQLKGDGVLRIVELDGPERIQEIPHAHIQPEVFRSEQAAREDLQFMAALNAYEAFSEPTKRLTSLEAQQIASAGAARAKAEQDVFERFISGIGQDTLALLQEWSVATREFPVFEDNRIVDWRHFTLEEIQGEYWVEVYIGSTMAPNRKALAEQIGLLMQSAPNFIQGIMAGQQAGIDLRSLFRQILEGVPEIRDVEKIVPDQEGGMMGQGLPQGIPPELLAGLAGQMMPQSQGAGLPGPFPGMRPDGSFDVAQADYWLRQLADEDLASYTNGA